MQHAYLVICDTGLIIDYGERTTSCFGGLSALPWYHALGLQWAADLPALIAGVAIGMVITAMVVRKRR